MNNTTALLIEELSSLKGKSADHITRFLKKCGGGEDSTMADGLIKIVEILNEDKKYGVRKAAVSNFVLGGAICTVITGVSACLIYKHHEKCQSRQKMQEVAEILKQEVALANEEKFPVNESTVIEEA